MLLINKIQLGADGSLQLPEDYRRRFNLKPVQIQLETADVQRILQIALFLMPCLYVIASKRG